MGKKAKSKYPRRRKKHRGVRAFFTVLTFCVIVGAIIMSLTVFLKVAKVEVRGAARYKSSDIVLASGIKVGDNLFGINKFAVSDKVLKKYPYIETLKITRRLPDTFVFTVTERVPCGYIDLGEQRWIIDKTGTLLERTSVKKKINLPKILAGEPLLAPV
ncbi:MAG: FtsQ-type POTRA domain-containing protein, partial [Clostridia bacterium]